MLVYQNNNYSSEHPSNHFDIPCCHLYFQFFEEHASVEESRRKQTEPIDLDTCLQAFTKEEDLGEEELYYCSKCKKHCLASKKLDIWRLPPILVGGETTNDIGSHFQVDFDAKAL